MRILLACVVAVLVLAPAAEALTPPPPTEYKRCRGIRDAGPTGSDPADVRGLKARRISCRRARRVARRWLSPDTTLADDGSVRFVGWICRDGIGEVNGVQRTKVRCKRRGGKRVRFYLG